MEGEGSSGKYVEILHGGSKFDSLRCQPVHIS